LDIAKVVSASESLKFIGSAIFGRRRREGEKEVEVVISGGTGEEEEGGGEKGGQVTGVTGCPCDIV
jgi:hypothetical protein